MKPERRSLHGVLDKHLPPALRIESGDCVEITTLEADWRLERPHGKELTAREYPRIPGHDDGHALCGPIYVNGAQKGMALKIEIGPIVPDDWGWSCVGIGNKEHLEGLGFRGEQDFKVWEVDRQTGECHYSQKFRVPAEPFPGVLAVAPKGEKAVRTHIPGNHGGNLDCKELRPGSVLYLPVFHDGALFSLGDGHAAQGDGESGGTAVECPFKSIQVKLSAVDFLIESPVARSEKGWITFGFDEDVTAAAYEALKNMRLLLKKFFGIEEKEAMTICSVAADLHITQMVNGIRGVHAIIPENIWENIKKE